MLLKSVRRAFTTSTSPRTLEYIERELKYGCHNYGPARIVIARGKGAVVWDVDGKRYYDYIAGIASVNQGHCHPHIISAINDQAQRVYQLSRAVYSDQLGGVQELLNKLFGYDKSVLMSTGFEAVDTAIKFARRWAYNVKGVPDNKAKVLFPQGNFWGRGLSACGASDDPIRFTRFGPFDGLNFELVEYDNINALEEKFKADANIAAYVMEPIQGERGIIMPKDGYLKQVVDLCKKYNVLSVFDEIQVGLGRTGKLLAHHWEEGVRPDMVVLGKSLSGGAYPVSAVLADNAVMDQIRPGEHGSTWGGNPLASAVARAGLEVIVDEDLTGRSLRLGKTLHEGLKDAFAGKAWLKEIRAGRGLYAGLHLADGMPSARVAQELLARGVLVYAKGDVIRLIPPLVITEDELKDSLKGFKDGVKDL